MKKNILRLRIKRNNLKGLAGEHFRDENSPIVKELHQRKQVSLGADINRVVIPGTDTTDFTWYLKRLVPILEEAGLLIDLIECQHTRY